MRTARRNVSWAAIASIFLLAAVTPSSSDAIIIHAWTFEELATVSDEVLVVQRLAARDTARRVSWPLPGSRFKAEPPLEAAEWEADLRVLLQLKGSTDPKIPLGSKVRLRYYRVDTGGRGMINGPPPEIDFAADKGSYYLMFLRRVGADLFEPASKDDTPIDSIFSLQHTGSIPIDWERHLPAPPPSR
jgi:hypothetical protein